MMARIYNDGYCVRVDLGATGQNYPNCEREQRGFPHLAKYPEGESAWSAAVAWAIEQGATDLLVSSVGVTPCGMEE